MANVAVIGAQWGDEGKGKIVDWLSERAEVVVRFQGGHNAGHTLVIGNQTYKLALLPSGVVRPGKLSIIGNGVVIDPWHFLEEVRKVNEQGLSVPKELGTRVNHLAPKAAPAKVQTVQFFPTRSWRNRLNEAVVPPGRYARAGMPGW